MAKNLRDLCLSSLPFRALGKEGNLNRILVESSINVIRVDVEILLISFNSDKAKSLGMSRIDSLQFLLIRDTVTAKGILFQASIQKQFI